MNYFVCFFIAIAETIAMVIYCLKKEKLLVLNKKFSKKCINREIETNSETIIPFSFLQSVIIISLSFAIFISTALFLFLNCENWFGFAKLIIVAFIVVVSAIVDFKKKIIPNILIVFGIVCRVIIYILEIVYLPNKVIDIFKNDLVGFGIGFGILFIACIISKKSIGFGDVKLFGIIGICSGGICTYSTLLFALIINTIVSILAIILKKKNKKDSLPFAPSICIGYLVAIFISSF